MSKTAERTALRASAIQDCLQLATAHENAGDLGQALFNCRRALALDPNNSSILRRIARTLGRQGQSERAIGLLEGLVAREPEVAAHLGDLASELLNDGRRREAREVAERAVALDAEDGTALLALGRTYEAHRQFEEADSTYARMLDLDPADAQALGRRGALALRRSDLDDAEGNFLHALAANPQLIPARLGLAEIQSNRDLADEALTNYLHILEHSPDCEVTLTQLVGFLRDRKLTRYPEALGQAFVSAFYCDRVDAYDLSRPVAYFLRNQFKLDRSLQTEGSNSDAVQTLAHFPLWHLFMRRCLNTDAQIERWILATRRWLLLEVDPQEFTDVQITLAASIGTQSLRNGYVYPIHDEEGLYLDAVTQDIDEQLEAEGGCSRELFEMLGLESMYRNPVTPARHAAIARGVTTCRNEGLRKLLETALALEEAGDSHVASLGRAREGESPPAGGFYVDTPPRVPARPLVRILENHDVDPAGVDFETLRVLVVTTADPRPALVAAQAYRGSEVTGVHANPNAALQASQRAEQRSIRNLTMTHGQALQLGRLGETFHVIECPDTFVHQPDPERALDSVVGCLEPNGLLRVTLPSRRARRNVPGARQRALKLGLTRDYDSVRRFRQRLVHGLEPSLVELLLYDDFYRLEDCFNLLFPEHTNLFSPLDIEEFLASQNLEFLGFNFPDRRLHLQFQEHFPDTESHDLNVWDRLEETVPSAFKNGLDFWCRRVVESSR